MTRYLTWALFIFGVAVIGLAVTLLLSSPSSAGISTATLNGSAAQWSSPSVSLSALAGTTTQMTVTLTAAAPTPAARVIISKKLRPYVAVSPTSIGALARGGYATFTLTLSSTASTVPTTTSGYLKLRAIQDRSTDDDVFCDGPVDDVRIARRLSVTAAITWTPVLLPGGVALSVPPILVASVDSSTGELSLVTKNAAAIPGIDGGGIGVSIDANPNKLSMTDYYSGNPGAPGADLGASVGTTSIAGRVGFVFEPTHTMSCDVVVVVQQSDGSFVKIDDYGCGFQ